MGTDDRFYETWDEDCRYRTFYNNYIIYRPESREFRFDSDILTENSNLYKIYSEKFDEILYDVLLDFSGSGLKMTHNYSPNGESKIVTVKIVIEQSDKKTSINYDSDTHEISGFVWMSLGDRDLTEITKEEVEIIRRSLLIWIYENI